MIRDMATLGGDVDTNTTVPTSTPKVRKSKKSVSFKFNIGEPDENVENVYKGSNVPVKKRSLTGSIATESPTTPTDSPATTKPKQPRPCTPRPPAKAKKHKPKSKKNKENEAPPQHPNQLPTEQTEHTNEPLEPPRAASLRDVMDRERREKRPLPPSYLTRSNIEYVAPFRTTVDVENDGIKEVDYQKEASEEFKRHEDEFWV